jgi:hypothetical protein
MLIQEILFCLIFQFKCCGYSATDPGSNYEKPKGIPPSCKNSTSNITGVFKQVSCKYYQLTKVIPNTMLHHIE